MAKGKLKIVPTNARYLVAFSYQVRGAYAYLGTSSHADCTEAIQAASKIVHFDDPLHLSVPYNYLASRLREPPDNAFTRAIAMLTIAAIFALVMLKGYSRLCCIRTTRCIDTFHHLGCLDDDEAESSGYEPRAIALTISSTDTPLCSFDTDGTPFVIDNSATCCICNDRQFFVGQLQPSDYNVVTSNRQSTPQQKGTIRIQIADDTGKLLTYELPEAIYDPDSPFNILGVPFLADYFGDSGLQGTTVLSGATESLLVWDHGKHERHFTHGQTRIPELHLNTGFGKFASFSRRLANYYNDNVHYSFSTACSIACDEGGVSHDTMNSAERRRNALNKLGASVLFKPGKGRPERVVYEGASADGLHHFIRHKDGRQSLTTSPHLCLINQADLSNLPKSPLDYCREVGTTLLALQTLSSPVWPSFQECELENNSSPVKVPSNLCCMYIRPGPPSSLEDQR